MKKNAYEELMNIFKLVTNTNQDLSAINKDTRLVEDLGLTSVGVIYLAVAIEETFDVDITSVSFDTFKTVQDVLDFIEK